MKNYYEILEVDKKASNKVIKGVYKLHIKEKHPDLFQGKEKLLAEERLKEINEAYEVLSDDVKRKEYDEALEQELENKLIELKEENEELKDLLKNDNDIKGYNKEEEHPKAFQTEYVASEEETYENTAKYIMHIMSRDRIIKIIVTICVVIAASVGIYKATGVNLLEIIWNAVVKTFSR